jgi:hypothetical protein
MNARLLFEDDDVLFDSPSNDRASHVELRVDGLDERTEDRETLRDLAQADNFLARIPQLALEQRDLALLPLDHREGFLLSMVDGVTSVETILDVCAMPADEALVILESLVERGVLLIPR